ncbi:MAG TPA: glycoside hydrolase family 3 N-terminal domain-containing protein [Rhizomicrobium sp.]|nr:glycoside hydrolase family 3 N-terminal domain-containing protein [Rhizomicrobium sp.]
MNRCLSAAFAVGLMLSAAHADPIHPELWPAGKSGVADDPAIDAKVAALLARMPVEDKIGQVIQPDSAFVTLDDVRKYRFGSIMSGGNSGPGGNDRAPAPAWLKMADDFYAAEMAPAPGHVGIPPLWGSDAVHGNSNIAGATIFPHNIGLGAANDPALLREIGAATAKELRVIGGDWTFAPTVAVVRDDRWGRTYEGYAEEPRLVSDNAAALIEGLQGMPGDQDFLKVAHVLATAKHFLGDGGTDAGVDQGENQYGEAALRDLFAPPYEAAIAAGAQTVMASYSSWRGQKLHGDRALLNDVLVGRFGFNGFVVGDWNGYMQLPGCTHDSCPDALLAGVDMIMAPDGWRKLYDNTLAQVQSGAIPMARLDEAVSRILRVKFRTGLMDAPAPSARPYAGQWNLLGAPEHRAVARRAVRETLVLLKNEHGILPLSPKLDVLVAGDGADNLPKQSGGWTISWQGDGNSRADFPGGTSIFDGIRDAVRAAGGTATLGIDGAAAAKPDIAIVVFGENPYAEFLGDRADVDYQPGNRRDLALLKSLKARGIPVVSVFLSGRPLYVSPEINASDAFVAAWLPGSEGAGVADMLFKKADGGVAYDFRGRLSYSWPRAPEQTPLNVGIEPYDPLFAFGYGLDYAHPKDIGALPEVPEPVVNADRYVENGKPVAPWQVALTANKFTLSGPRISLMRDADRDRALEVAVRMVKRPKAPVMLSVAGGAVDVTKLLPRKGKATLAVRLTCFRAASADLRVVDAPLAVWSSRGLPFKVISAKLSQGVGAPLCPG